MNNNLHNLREHIFIPLSEAKAKLSAFVSELFQGSNRLILTVNGRPKAVLMAYEDYLTFSNQEEPKESEVISLEEWRKGRENRKKVRDSLLKIFDPSQLSKKGQKSYKESVVRSFDRKN